MASPLDIPAVFSALRAARSGRRYLRAPQPLSFPAGPVVPESRWHFELRTALFQVLQAAFGDRAVIGSDQFVYWGPANPRACCAPDVMVRLGEPDAPFDSWKVWERGAPQLAIELLSKAEPNELAWADKLERYQHVGVAELVRFDRDDERTPLRLWDNIEGDLVERDPAGPRFRQSDVLGAYWQVQRDPTHRWWLRLSHDELGNELFLTPREQSERAQAKLAELEKELARLKNG